MNTNLLRLSKVPGLESEHAVNRVITIVVLALLVHFFVWGIKLVSEWLIRKSAAKKIPVGFVTRQPKFVTLTGLIASALTFAIYFAALGLVLTEYHVDLTTYLATASVIGLAVGFGSQGMVQDVVTGLTLILSDTLDVGDIIEVAGRIGRVERVGLRFTLLNNFNNQQVYVPNRIIADIARYPRAQMSGYADVEIPSGMSPDAAAEEVLRIAHGMWIQFASIILEEPELVETDAAPQAPWKYLRVRFRIWPGQGTIIENTFRQRVVQALKKQDPNYADWMVTLTYRAIVRSRTGVEG
ncbi:MAG TPA: mechanosensitive ion channel domain-containing protein [Verrucomicrobiae bacterium]|nr:mechanosensitive ion channel domain-containing protein [Verrucomicrobiae bacterium]